jgi:hypothetical protein
MQENTCWFDAKIGLPRNTPELFFVVVRAHFGVLNQQQNV